MDRSCILPPRSYPFNSHLPPVAQALLLERSEHHPLDEVALRDGIDEQHRDRGDHDHGVTQQRVHGLDTDDLLHGAAARLEAILTHDEQAAQHQLQRIQRLVLQEDQRIEIGIPLAHRVQQEEHRDDRVRGRQDDPQQELQLRAAVQPRRIIELAGYRRLEEGLGQEDLEDAQRRGEDQRPARVEQAEVFDHQIERDQAAVEDEGEDQEPDPDLPPDEVLARERVGHHDGDGGADEAADEGVEYRIEEARHHQIVLEHGLIAK